MTTPQIVYSQHADAGAISEVVVCAESSPLYRSP
jgi:hypothetical protein